MATRNTKQQLLKDFQTIFAKAALTSYSLQPQDAFALGYMAAKYGLEKLIDNEEAVLEACRQYDETDDLSLLDTIGETLIDMEVIKNDGRL